MFLEELEEIKNFIHINFSDAFNGRFWLIPKIMSKIKFMGQSLGFGALKQVFKIKQLKQSEIKMRKSTQ